jgi:L,D-peptidoglycan transpeptidase YkuD (ErfK/YbiS/YcfS/YnhG family)
MKRCLGLLIVSLAVLETSSSVSALPVATQSVIVEVSSASASVGTLKLIETVDGIERVVLGPVPTRVGRNGVKRDRREGDGTTPLGSMAITGGFGLAAKARTDLAYRRVVAGDCWISDVGDPAYNRRVRRSRCDAPNEDLYRIAKGGAYEFALTTDYNASPIVTGKGSAIFVHVHSYDAAGRTKPTSGCVSVARSVMKRLFAMLDPAKNPVLVVRIRR